MAAARGVLSSLRYCEEVPTNLVKRYLWLGSHRVNGWLAPFIARFIAALARAQIRNGIDGAVAEIGVHHGRLFTLMHLTSRVGQKDIAVDIFEKQHLNRYHSGRGDLARFLSNLQRCGGRSADVVIAQQSSLDLNPADILQAVGHVRFFSVDGGHTEEWWRQLRAAAAETELGVTLRRVRRRLIRPTMPSIEPKAYHW